MSVPPDDPDRTSILIVDDDRDVAATMAGVLAIFGHRVRLAHDGYDALEIARRARPSHVLLETALPGLDGCRVAVQLRRTPSSSTRMRYSR